MAVTDADFAPTRFSTDDVAEQHRLPRWREEFGRTLVGVEIEPLSPEHPFQAKAVLRALPGLRIALCDGAAMHYERTRALAAESDGSIGLIINLAPKAAATHLGESLELAAGSAVMRLIPSTAEPLRLLVSYLKLVQEEVTLAAPELRQAVVSHIHDLVALALGASRDTRQSGLSAVAAARLAAAIADINRSFSDPGLTLAAVALRQGVSQRYLQRLFEEHGMPFTARVTELRLQRAFALLSREHNRGRPISEIAWQAGFSNISHFNRLFRARFGDTPSGIRS